MKGVYDKQFLK